VLIYRFVLIKCDVGKPDFEVFTRISGKEYESVDG
jgi:MinD superfamily P-loop ATPase